LEWAWIIALIGYSRVLLDRTVPLLTGFTRYALPFYIFHQAVIVWLGWTTFGWSDMPLLKYPAIAGAALLISYCLARLFDLSAVTRFLVGLKAPKPRGSSGVSGGDIGKTEPRKYAGRSMTPLLMDRVQYTPGTSRAVRPM